MEKQKKECKNSKKEEIQDIYQNNGGGTIGSLTDFVREKEN